MRAVSSVTSAVLPSPERDFVDLLRRNYRPVKHADQARRDGPEMHLAYLQSIQVFRAWAGIRLGGPESALAAGIATIEAVLLRKSILTGRGHRRCRGR